MVGFRSRNSWSEFRYAAHNTVNRVNILKLKKIHENGAIENQTAEMDVEKHSL